MDFVPKVYIFWVAKINVAEEGKRHQSDPPREGMRRDVWAIWVWMCPVEAKHVDSERKPVSMSPNRGPGLVDCRWEMHFMPLQC